MAPTKVKTGAAKGANKRSTQPNKSTSSSKAKKAKASNTRTTQHKPAPASATAQKTRKKAPHERYTEKELKVPHLNGIRPTGVQKAANRKKGKSFVDDGAGMKAIMAMVMAEKEGNIESRMMRARQMEEIREAKRQEAEERAEGRRKGLEGRKEEIKGKKGKRKDGGGGGGGEEVKEKKPKKSVRFG